MTRFKLNCCGELMNGPTMPSMSTFKILAIMTGVYVIFNWVTSAIINANDEDGDEYNTSGNEEEGVVIISIVSDLVDLAFGLFVLFITMRTRGFIRRKYDIPTKCCGNCEGKMLVPLCAAFLHGSDPKKIVSNFLCPPWHRLLLFFLVQSLHNLPGKNGRPAW